MNRPIRILHVLGALDRGGTETMLINLYRKINTNKIQFDFVIHTTSICAYEKEIIDRGGRIYRVPKYIGINHFSYLESWKSLISKHTEYQIIHVHIRSTSAIILGIAKRFKRLTIMHSHGVSNGRGISAFIKTLLQFRSRYIADYLFAASLEAGEWMFGNKINSNNFFLLNNSIDSDKFSFKESDRIQIREMLNIQNEFVVGHIGRFVDTKNHSFIIEVFKELLKKNENSILLLIGKGELEKSIKDRVIDYGINDKVIFLGEIEEVNRYLCAMDVFIFPSKYEGFGNVAIESQSTGLPTLISEPVPKKTIVTDLVRVKELSDSPEEWANSLLSLKKETRSCEAHTKVKMAGFDLVKSVDFLEKMYLRFFDEVYK